MDNAGASVSSAADERGSDDEVKKLVRDRSLEAMFVDIPKVTHTHESLEHDGFDRPQRLH